MLLDQDLQEQKQEQEIKLSDTEIFTKIWISPRMVFKYLNDYSYEKFVTILLILAGITRTFDRASTRGVGDNMSLGRVIILCVILGGLLGWITYYIYAAMISWTGKWLNGKGGHKINIKNNCSCHDPFNRFSNIPNSTNSIIRKRDISK